MTSYLRRHWALPVVTAVALVTRLSDLTRLPVLVFDELYWVPNATDLIQWGSTHGQFRHPPLGQWVIASGIAIFGLTPFGWRIGSLVMGVATVALVVLTVQRLCKNQFLAFVAGMLCVVDGVLFTTSRVGMLDASAGFFVSLTTFLLVILVQSASQDRSRLRRIECLVLVVCGLAGSVKWYGFGSIPIVLALMISADLRLVAPQLKWRNIAVSVALSVLLPLGVYLLAWAPQQAGPDAWRPGTFVSTHAEVVRFHAELRPDNTSAASAWTWFTMSHPTIFYGIDCANKAARASDGPCYGQPPDSGAVLMVFANPIVWLICLGALVGLVLRAVRGKSVMAAVLFGVPFLQWLPWLVSGRAAYTFYLTTVIPTLVVGAAWLIGPKQALHRRVPIFITLGLAVLAWVFFRPVWIGQTMSNQQIGARMWWWGIS